jgi:hypothetical protein
MVRRCLPLLAFDDEEDEIERLPFTALRGSLWPLSMTTNETRVNPLKAAPGAIFSHQYLEPQPYKCTLDVKRC